MTDLTQMDAAALVALNQDLGREIDALRDRRRAIGAELARREEAAALAEAQEAVARRLGRRPGAVVAPGAVMAASGGAA